MAPTTRRAAKLAVLSHDNKRGFPALPNELYSEILSHLPAFPIPQDMWLGQKPDPYRQLALYCLSQTCRSLRRFFLRYAWERIEVFGGMWAQRGKLNGSKGLVRETLRQLETVVVRNPELREYVTTVDLTIPMFSHKTVLPVIAQNLSLLPNLHTLQLIFQFYYHWSKIFSEFRYPTIQTLNLNFLSPRKDIILACPNTRQLSLYEDEGDWRRRMCRAECMGSTTETLGMIPYLDLHEIVIPWSFVISH